MRNCFFAAAAALILVAALAAPAAIFSAPQAPPRRLTDFASLLAAREDGARVRAVFHYKDMKLFIDKKEEPNVPDAVGGIDVDTFEYFGANAVGNPEAFLSFSRLQFIRHPRYGAVNNYIKVSVYASGRVGIVAQYLALNTYEVKMDEYFDTVINDGANKAGAHFYLSEGIAR
jgi:hypothetical protein